MIFNQRPVSHPLGGHRGWGQNSTFSEHGHVAYQIKENHKCSNMVANILPTDPGDGVNRSKLNFFRTWSCCISFKDNHKWSNMVADMLPPTQGMGSGQNSIFQNIVVLHIKLKRITNAATWLPADPPPRRAYNFDLHDTQGELRGWRNGIYVL